MTINFVIWQKLLHGLSPQKELSVVSQQLYHTPEMKSENSLFAPAVKFIRKTVYKTQYLKSKKRNDILQNLAYSEKTTNHLFQENKIRLSLSYVQLYANAAKSLRTT